MLSCRFFVSAGEGEIAANGLLGRVRIGEGVALLVSITPDMLHCKRADIPALFGLAFDEDSVSVARKLGCFL
jgi:hypothetical protein